MNEESLFAEALAHSDPAERAAFLDRACGGDAALRQRAEALLQAHDEAGGFLDKPAATPEATGDVAPGRWLDVDALPAAPIEGVGSRIGPYKLLQQIGEGGMGVVFMAEQQQPVRRMVALKVIKAGMDSTQVVARFEAERQALALMDHPNIAKVLDAGTTASGRPYFVMELVKGIPMTKYCDEQRLSPKQRLELFVPVCQAIQHAHQKGIIHRDIKPSNVLIAAYDGKPVPKVIDFGVAKAAGQKLTERTLFTGFGGLVGTLEYMSPEQAEFNALDIDTRSDIYSLGVLLYELLAGSTPLSRQRIKNAAIMDVLRLIREEEAQRPSTRLSESKDSLASVSVQRHMEPAALVKAVRGEVDWIVMKALEKDRSRRYETANGLARDIQRYLADEPVEAGPPSATYRLRKYLRRHRGPVLAAALLLLALLLGIAGTTAGLLRAEAARREEKEQRRLAEDERDAKDEARKEAQASQKEAKHQESVAQEQKHRAEANAAEAKQQQQIAEKQKGETEKQAAIALAVNEFLQKDLLGQSDVGQQMLGQREARDPDVKVRTLLDRASKSIAGKFQELPLTEAAIRLTIGTTYWALGRYEEAQPHLERSVQLRRTQLGADHTDTLTSKNNLALLYWSLGKYDEAEPLLLEALKGRTAQMGTDHPDTLTSKNNLALLYKDQGKYDRAEPLYLEALKGRTAKLGASHPDTLNSKTNLATLYMYESKYDKAEPLLLEVLKGYTAQLGTDHPVSLGSKGNLAMLYQSQSKYDKAEPLLMEVLKGYTAQLGTDHPNTLTSKNNLALLYKDQGNYDKAEPLYLEVLEASTAKLGAGHPNTLSSKSNLAMLYWRQRRLKESVPLFEEVVRAYRTKLGGDHPNTLRALANLGVNYRDAGRIEDAIPLLEEAVQRAGKLPGGFPRSLAWVPPQLAQTYDQAGMFAKAEPLYRASLEQARRQFGADDLRTAGQMAVLGLNLLHQHKYPDAEPILRDCLKVRESKQVDAWNTFNTQSMLGAALLGQKKYTDAEPLLLKGYNGMKKREKAIPKQGKVRLTEAIERLVQLYEAAGKKDEAAKWRKELEMLK